MLFLTSLSEKDIYEGDVIYSGGTVEYTGEVVHRGVLYTVEKAVVSLGSYSFTGYMKRFRAGNAVLCSHKLKDCQSSNYKQYYSMVKMLRRNDVNDDAIFVFRAVREFMLLGLSALMILFLFGLWKCFDCFFLEQRGMSAIFMGLVFVIAIFLMKYLKYLCKIRLPYGYIPKPDVLKILRANHRPFEVGDFEDEE